MNGKESIEQQVAADMAARSRKGVLKYGFTVAENPLPLLAWLQHAYEESLDLPIYLKRAIVELEGKELAHAEGAKGAEGTDCNKESRKAGKGIVGS